MIKINEHGCLSIESADKTITIVFANYVTSIHIGNFWFQIGRDDVYDDENDEMFFSSLHWKLKEIVNIYSYLPTSLQVRLFGKELCS